MKAPRRLGITTSDVRERFVDAAEWVLIEVGAHAVSARTVASRAELKTQLLYYYFQTMDDVLRAVVRRIDERRRLRFQDALAAPEPLLALWEMMIDRPSAALAAELIVIANHRAAVRDEIVLAARAFRIAQTEALTALLPRDAPILCRYSPAGLVMIAASLARMIVNEAALGLSEGHAEAREIVEDLLKHSQSP